MRIVLALACAAIAAPLAVGGAAKVPPAPVEGSVVRTGRAPCGIAARTDTVWVGVYEAGALVRLDRRGRVTLRVRLGSFVCRVAVAEDAIWVTRDNASEVVRFEPRTGDVRRVAVSEPFDVLVARGSLWVTSHAAGIVARLDPGTGRLLDEVTVGTEPVGLAWCGGRVWVGHGDDARWVSSIDPATLATHRVPVLAPEPRWPTCIRGVVWVVAPADVVRIDARRGRVLTHLLVGGTMSDAAAAPDGTVWATDKEHSLVRRLARSGRQELDSFPAGRGAFALARAGRSMWVTSFAGRDVRRYDTR